MRTKLTPANPGPVQQGGGMRVVDQWFSIIVRVSIPWQGEGLSQSRNKGSCLSSPGPYR